jgi:signal transduction histidine kinase
LTDQLRIYGQNLDQPMIEDLRERGFFIDEMPSGPVDAVLLHSAPGEGPDLTALAMLRLEHPDSLILLSSAPPPPRRLIEWIRAGLDDWVDAAEGGVAISEAVRSSVQRRKIARQQRAVVASLEERRRQAESEERELSDHLVAVATELETEHERLGHAHSALQNRVAQLVMLYRIGRNLSSHRNWDEALAELLEQMKLFLAADGMALLLRSQGGERLAPRAVLGVDEERIEEVVVNFGPRHGEPEFAETLFPLESLSGGPLTPCADRREAFSTTIVPLSHRGRDLGCLVVAKPYADGIAFSDDYYFLVTIRTVVAEEVAAAQTIHELRRLQRFQERTLEQLASGILTVDADGIVGFANRTALQLLGVASADDIDFDQQLRLGAESPPLRRWIAGISSQAAGTIDARVHSRDGGESIPVSLIVSSLPGEAPGELQYVCVLEDGRQSQALEAERRRAARQKELLIMAAEWAHDVRTPLTGILHSAELLVDAVGKQSSNRHFEVIRAEVERINELVNHFLDYARPVQLKEQDRELPGLVSEAAALMEGLARERGCHIETEAAAQSARVRVDPDQFKQVLLNLLTNALDVAPTGTAVGLRVFVGEREEISVAGRARAAVVAEIIDQGVGVKPADIDRLFIPFFTTKSEGTGLGLAISEKIIRAHGGTLRHERAAGQTIFRIVLPQLETGPRLDDETKTRRRGLQARG